MGTKYRKREETQEFHENFIEEQFALCELSNDVDFDYQQKIRNAFRYQVRGYCFELPPPCSRYGRGCFSCPYVKCRENEEYDKDQFYNSETDEYDYDPDINRFARLSDTLFELADFDVNRDHLQVDEIPPKIDSGRSLDSLLAVLAEGTKMTMV